MGGWLTGTVGAEIGYVENAGKYRIPTTGGYARGVYNTDSGYRFEGKVGAGPSAFYQRFDLKKDFKLSENLSLTTGLTEQYTKSNTKTTYYDKMYYAFDDVKPDKGPEWRPADLRGYGEVGLLYKGNIFEVGAGVRAGVRTSTQPSLGGVKLDKSIGTTKGTEYAGTVTEKFAEWTAHARADAGKGWYITLNVSPSCTGLSLSKTLGK